ncbi:MAG: acyl-CoA thioesterase [Vagococcus sp.]
MFIDLPETKKCKESRVVQTHRIFPPDLNSFGALFGGRLMTFIDDTTSISASRHCRRPVMTASTDKLDFLHPLYENHSVCVESYVTGTGHKSMEVFAKVIGENLDTGDRYLAATCFMTFVIVECEDDFKGVPSIVPETNEEIMIHQGYAKRRDFRLQELKHNQELGEHISLSIPWIDA